jgi:hypothetical protein
MAGGGVIQILSSLNLVKALTDLVESFVSNKKERDELKLKITEVVAGYDGKLEKEITKRLEIDSKAESKLTRNVRPLTLIYLTVLVTVMSFIPGAPEMFVSKFLDAWWLAIVFYFGSRGIEKVIQTIKK